MTADNHPPVKLGSLCSGYGGLDMACATHFGAELVWVSEIDRDACAVLAHRWPDVSNIGDLRHATPPPVDVVCAGFPCQPASTAGRRQGVADNRWLWPDIVACLRRMDPPPRTVVLENVPGLLTVDGGDAVAGVLHDLAALGCDARWCVVRASDVGAPHRRARWFCVAADTARPRWDAARSAICDRRGEEGVPRAGSEPRRRGGASADSDGGRAGRNVGPVRAASPRPRRPHPDDDGQPRMDRRASADTAECDTANVAKGTHAAALVGAITGADDRTARRATPEGTERPVGVAGMDGGTAWGRYGPAIERWGRVVGRPAPDPVDDRGRLNPRLSEWMMGLPDGWVTDLLGRGPALRVIGNGVVPQQAAHALGMLVA